MADISKITLPNGSEYNIKDANAQQKILVSGILEGDGEGGISASDIMDYDTDTASGAVASFTADSVAPLKSLLVNIDPVQDLHGYDNPWPAGGGKNKFDISKVYEGLGYTFSDGVGSCSIGYGVGGRVIPYTDGISVTSGASITISADVYLASAEAGTNKNVSIGAKNTFASGSYTKNDISVNAFNTWQRISSTINAPGDTIWIGIQPRMDGYTVQFKNLQVELGSPATPYAPYSNLCPISGWDGANLWRTGRNLAKLSSENAGDNQRSTVSYTDSGAVVTATGTYGRYGWQIPVKAGSTYTISYKAVASDAGNNNRIYFGSKAAWNVASDGYLSWQGVTTTEAQYSVTVTVPSDTLFIGLYVSALGTSGSMTISDLQVELSSTPTTYTPYTGNQFTIQLGQTVYGGTFDVTNGVLTVTHILFTRNSATMNNTEDYPGWKDAGVRSYGFPTGNYYNIIGSVGNRCSINTNGTSNDVLFLGKTYYGKTQTEWIALAIDVQFVLPLPTPIIIPLTATQISTLQGENNLWADTGDITIEYRNGENALLRDVAEAVENLQGKIQVNGLLKSNGNGEVFLAEPGTDYATPSQIPAVPSASTANPQMDGAPSPGSTGQWSDGGHTHPTDTTRAAAELEINGHPLTRDFDLTAADVGALASNGTARSSYTLFPTKVYPGTLAAGWYKFAEVNITAAAGRAKITFKYGLSNVNYDFIGDIFVYKTNSTTMNCSMQIPYSVSGKITYFRYNIDSANTVSFYVYKHDAYGNPVFTFITSEDINGNYLEPSTYMLESLVAGTPPATALKPIYSAINRWVYNVPVSPGTNAQILSYSLGMITSASVLAKIEFANPGYIKSDCAWETTDGVNPNDNGTITITGTCTAATTANLLILNVLPY